MNCLTRLCHFVFWVYIFGLLVVAVTIYLAGDRFWWGTVLMFGPRWIWGIPLPIAVLAGWRLGGIRRWVSILAIPVFGYFILAFNFPVGVVVSSQLPVTRVMTLNLEGGIVDWQKLNQLISLFEPDVMLFQECPNNVSDYLLPSWNTNQVGEIAIASRYPLGSPTVVNRSLGHRYPRAIGVSAMIDLPSGTVTIASIHLLSPSDGLNRILSRNTLFDLTQRTVIEQEIDWRRDEAGHLSSNFEDGPDTLIIAGDFNMPVESSIYRSNWSAFQNAFSWSGFGCGATAFQERGGLWNSSRIDHVLYRGDLRCTSSWIGRDVGSDHRPLFADMIHSQSGSRKN